MMISNMAAGIIAIKTGFRGPSYSPVSACATGNQAIGEAYLNITMDIQMRFCWWLRSSYYPIAFAGFSRMRAMSTQNSTLKKQVNHLMRIEMVLSCLKVLEFYY